MRNTVSQILFKIKKVQSWLTVHLLAVLQLRKLLFPNVFGILPTFQRMIFPKRKPVVTSSTFWFLQRLNIFRYSVSSVHSPLRERCNDFSRQHPLLCFTEYPITDTLQRILVRVPQNTQTVSSDISFHRKTDKNFYLHFTNSKIDVFAPSFSTTFLSVVGKMNLTSSSCRDLNT